MIKVWKQNGIKLRNSHGRHLQLYTKRLLSSFSLPWDSRQYQTFLGVIRTHRVALLCPNMTKSKLGVNRSFDSYGGCRNWYISVCLGPKVYLPPDRGELRFLFYLLSYEQLLHILGIKGTNWWWIWQFPSF